MLTVFLTIAGILKQIGRFILVLLHLLFLIVIIQTPVLSWLSRDRIGIEGLSFVNESIIRGVIFFLTLGLSLYLINRFAKKVGIELSERLGRLSKGEKELTIKFLVLTGVFSLIFLLLLLVIGGSVSDTMPSFWDNPVVFILRLATAVISQPILEELLFRGIIQEKLTPYSKWGGIILTSLLFSWLHGLGTLLNSQFVSSIVYGAVYHKTKNIKSTILLHSFQNLLFVVWIIVVR